MQAQEHALPRPAEGHAGLHRIFVVGGGAGGLELATRLGDTLGRQGRAHVTLIERARSHFWKPHPHEIAAGSMDLHAHATDYLAQSHWHGFRCRVGEMVGLDRARRLVHVAAVIGDEGTPAPPRAQAAHQQASHLVAQIRRRLRGQPLQPWRYRDFGSIVSLGEYATVGNLMGSLIGGNLWVEGLFARTMYLSLCKMHLVALHGGWKKALGSASRLLTRSTEPRVKLH